MIEEIQSARNCGFSKEFNCVKSAKFYMSNYGGEV